MASASVALPLLLIIVWLSAPAFTALAALAAAVGAGELSALVRGRSRDIAVYTAAAAGSGLVVLGHFGGSDQPLGYVVTVASLLTLLWLTWGRWAGSKTTLVAATLGGVLYAGGLLFHAPLLRALEQGMEWVFFVLLVTFATDTAAFFVGRSLGRRPLAPRISPAKTWEGALGGIVAALAVAVALGGLLRLNAGVDELLALGALTAVAGQVGDLAESRIKRVAGVKDSSSLIPGHGGLLDRLDSIVLNLVVVYYFVLWQIQ